MKGWTRLAIGLLPVWLYLTLVWQGSQEPWVSAAGISMILVAIMFVGGCMCLFAFVVVLWIARGFDEDATERRRRQE